MHMTFPARMTWVGNKSSRRKKELAMSATDKAKNTAEKVKGKAKETAGQVSGNDKLRAEGKTDQMKGDLKQAGEKVKDAFKK
jgi:uncharacterized protein YjbJ (UPF0337 family)